MSFVAVTLLLLIPLPAYAHRGGIDSYGCHHNRKAKIYQCHKGEMAGQDFASKRAMIAKKEGLSPPSEKGQDIFKAKVISVIDGDTLDVLYEGKIIRIRLADIDAPEMSQPYGPAAKQYVIKQSYGKIVQLRADGTGVHGRMIATIILPDGKSLNREILIAGWAWWYKKYSGDAQMAALEGIARKDKVGLWQGIAPTEPFKIRRGR